MFSLSWERLRRPRLPAAAAELLGIAKPEFRGLHSRLRELGQFFLKPESATKAIRKTQGSFQQL